MVNARAMCRFLETRPQKAEVKFLSKIARKSVLFVDYYSHSALCVTANLVVSSWAIYYLFIAIF